MLCGTYDVLFPATRGGVNRVGKKKRAQKRAGILVVCHFGVSFPKNEGAFFSPDHPICGPGNGRAWVLLLERSHRKPVSVQIEMPRVLRPTVSSYASEQLL